MTTTLDMQCRVDRGLALLDAHTPDWAQKVDRPLSIYTCADCVLTQVFGGFNTGLEALDVDIRDVRRHRDLGLDCFQNEDTAITALWVAAIDERT